MTNMRRYVVSLVLPVVIVFLSAPDTCLAQWTKDIDCPLGTVYQDLRPDAGREEFCERLLPGSLKVKDGPYKFWFSEGNPGDKGAYKDGRQAGPWEVCNRFGKCTHVVYELTFPDEKDRVGFRREVPISFQHGKYIFDFASCWSTWVTQSGAEVLNLNIGGSPYRSNIAYLPQHFIEHSGDGDYLCRIPFSVGKRELDSPDLRREMAKLGLPQFCRAIDRKGEAFMLEGKSGEVATTVDIQSAVAGRDAAGHEILRFRLNR